MIRKLRLELLLAFLFGAAGCSSEGEGGEGDLSIQLEAETTIVDGVSMGEGEEDSLDYAVKFTKYLVGIGGVNVAQGDGTSGVSDTHFYVANMQGIGAMGVELAKFADLETGQWSEFSFATAVPDADAGLLGGATEADRAQMAENGWTYWIEGVVERPQAEGGPVTFVLQVPANTLYHQCESNGEPGVSVGQGTSSASVTLHGDHILFTAFTSGAEGVIQRRAGWIVEADTDGDGRVVTADLAAIDASTLFTSDKGYSLNRPIDEMPIVTALDFVRAQLSTQGHLNTEGECRSMLLE